MSLSLDFLSNRQKQLVILRFSWSVTGLFVHVCIPSKNIDEVLDFEEPDFLDEFTRLIKESFERET